MINLGRSFYRMFRYLEIIKVCQVVQNWLLFLLEIQDERRLQVLGVKADE